MNLPPDSASTRPRVSSATGRSRRRRRTDDLTRYLLGLTTVVAIVAIVAIAVGMFNGGFTDSVPVTVVSPRAGLVMDTGAKVTMRGAQVGTVASIEARQDGMAVLHLAMDPSQLHLIPTNVLVSLGSTTVFGAKSVQLVPPQNPSSKTMYAGQRLDAANVTVEINTVFDQLAAVLTKIDPTKLNEVLGALAAGLNGRGQELGQTLSDLDSFLATIEPSLPNLRRDIQAAPHVLRAYADASPDLLHILENATDISQTIVDEQHNLDALLLSAIGLADVGNDVLGTNGQALAQDLHLLVPTTDLTNEYHDALNCGLGGLIPFAKTPPNPVPGILTSVGLVFGTERYRYPTNLPKVAATGGPQCGGQYLPNVPSGMRPKFVVSDIGSNPWQYGNPGIMLNSDGLKQLLFGPIDGPPRNTSQIGQPG